MFCIVPSPMPHPSSLSVSSFSTTSVSIEVYHIYIHIRQHRNFALSPLTTPHVRHTELRPQLLVQNEEVMPQSLLSFPFFLVWFHFMNVFTTRSQLSWDGELRKLHPTLLNESGWSASSRTLTLVRNYYFNYQNLAESDDAKLEGWCLTWRPINSCYRHSHATFDQKFEPQEKAKPQSTKEQCYITHITSSSGYLLATETKPLKQSTENIWL